jgi:hypothetical protein
MSIAQYLQTISSIKPFSALQNWLLFLAKGELMFLYQVFLHVVFAVG